MKDFLTRIFRNEAEEKSTKPLKDERLRVAAAAILMEVVAADETVDETERAHVEDMLQKTFELPAETVAALIETAHAERARSVDMWEFTNVINQNYQRPEKIETLELVWRAIYADGVLDAREEVLARKLTHLLRLSHEDMIGAKLRARKGIEQVK